jgi:hypothetical protein
MGHFIKKIWCSKKNKNGPRNLVHSFLYFFFFVKMSQFIIEDGKGEMFNENGDKVSVLQMEVDDPNFPLGDVINYDEYHDLKLPEKQ